MKWETKSARLLPRRSALGMAVALAAAGSAHADNGANSYPTRPVQYINLFPPGGPTDILSRLVCDKLSGLAGQQFVVENRSGAGGTVGQTAIARAEPDGYTLGLGSIASLAIAPWIYPSLPFDPAKDFTFISGLWKVPNLLICNNDLPAHSVPELITLLKQNPGRYDYGSSGSGTSPHLSMELFKQMAGDLRITHVPYRGGAPALVDLLGGRVQLMFDNLPGLIGSVRDGKVRALAVTGPERSPTLPDVPTLAEFLPGYEITSWGGLVGPAGIPTLIVNRLANLIKNALSDRDLLRTFDKNGATAWRVNGEQFAAFRTQQAELFKRLVKTAGATAG